MKRARRRCAIGIDIANEISSGRKCESFDERAAFADRVRKIQRANERKFGGYFLHDTERVIAATVENDHQLEFAFILVAKVSSVLAQYRLDPRLFIVSGNQEQKAGLAHAALLDRQFTLDGEF